MKEFCNDGHAPVEYDGVECPACDLLLQIQELAEQNAELAD